MKKISKFQIVLVGCLSLLLYSASHAQEEEDSETGSRAIHRKIKTKNSKFDLKYNAGLFGGAYVEGEKGGLYIDLNARGRYRWGKHDFDLKLGYERDPFSTKLYNYDDSEQDFKDVRLVKQIDDLTSQLAWRARWLDRLDSKIRLLGSYRIVDTDTDNRWKVRISPACHYGQKRGIQADFEAFGTVIKYPNYQVNDRRIDQVGTGILTSGGYRWRSSELGLGYGLSFYKYDDARYDAMVNGNVERAINSKSHLKHFFELFGKTKPIRNLRIRMRYRFEINDSRNYNWEVQGRSADMSFVYKYIVDYYDYQRHRIDVDVVWEPNDLFSITASGGFWTRSFSQYETRSPDNVWLGELRVDNSFDASVELSYRLWTIHGGERKKPSSYLNLVCFVTHENRKSNMRRETSIATNFSITRVFAGVEVSGL